MCSCIEGYLFSFYDGTDSYVKKEKNDHYVYHNAATVIAIPNECLASRTTRECSPDKTGA